MLTPQSIKVTWDHFSSPSVTGYLISYSTTASYTSSGNVRVNGSNTKSYNLTNLEENTLYTIIVRATNIKGVSDNSNAVSVTTYITSK